jgi:aspartyl-tRNA(Asn)/glutamyl-tRNA(Gln) amidotransferase subunit B
MAIQLASNYIISDYLGLKKSNPEVKLTKPENFAELIIYAKTGKLSSRATKDIWGRILIKDDSPKEIAEKENLFQSNDEGALKVIVEKTIAANPEVVAIYKGGKENAIMSLVGKIIKESNGSANPQIVIKLLKEMLK